MRRRAAQHDRDGVWLSTFIRNASAIISAGAFFLPGTRGEGPLAGMLCPQCGGHTHRSHTRGFREKLVKTLTSHKTYRCRECGWRGGIRRVGASKGRPTLRTIISGFGNPLITTLLPLYLVGKLSLPPPRGGFEQQQTP